MPDRVPLHKEKPPARAQTRGAGRQGGRPQDVPDSGSAGLLLAGPPRIAVYTERHAPPRIVTLSSDSRRRRGGNKEGAQAKEEVLALIDELTSQTHALAQELGGRFPIEPLRELIANLVHAHFAEVVITILDGGNTIRISDHGPGIPDKRAAVRAGFTSAQGPTKRYINGVGAGLAFVQDMMDRLGGVLEIDDNLGGGTVVTVRIPPSAVVGDAPLASGGPPSYNLGDRQLKALLLTVELAPVGPTRIAQELGVSTSTAYRDLVALEEAGLVASQENGHRSVTEAGLEHLNTLL